MSILLFVSLIANLLVQATSGNPIQMENAKTGTSTWQLSNPAINHEIEGYASLTSVNRGDQINLFVNTTDPTYTIEIYRMGWYGGLGSRQVLGPITQTGIHQVIPSPNASNGDLVECNWINPYILSVPINPGDPTDWCSGVYLAKLTGQASGKQSYIIFVVRDDNRPAEFLFQSSVTTFQAYNEWGGRSLYGWGSSSCATPGGVKVSFNRPYFVCSSFSEGATGIGAGEFVTNEQPNWSTIAPAWEYNMVRFLEREGYDVTYCTDVDTHEDLNLLLDHKAFLSVGHDEYWSWEMRQNVEAARDQGVSLGFFSANTCHWQIRFEPSHITGASNRTVVCYKGMTDPIANDGDLSNDHLVTVHWRDNPVNRPEDTLLGVMWGFWPADADIVISDASHWVCAGTGLHDGDRLPGLVGYEADAMFESAPAGTQVVAHSPTPNANMGAGCCSDMTVYTVASGAIVFATGSIQWSWGLDDYNADPNFGPALRPSRLNLAAQQMTRNVLDHFRDVIYVDAGYFGATSNGSLVRPFRTVNEAYGASQNGYIIRITAGNYHESPLPLMLSKRLRIESRGGNVIIGP